VLIAAVPVALLLRRRQARLRPSPAAGTDVRQPKAP
jgi:hypothetical protein